MNRLIQTLLFLLLFTSFSHHNVHDPFVVVLGITQDAGYPHVGCKKKCCAELWKDISKKRMVSCLAVVDPETNERWIFDATPDFPSQLHLLHEIHPIETSSPEKNTTAAHGPGISGVFLSHAHIGHYTGLVYLGREGIASKNIPVYAMPRLREYLTTNGPWSQLVQLHNIDITPIEENTTIKLSDRISVTPFRVPHRDEYSETVGFFVKGPNKSFLFIPDIDKWEKWETRIEAMIAKVDYAFLDGTFFDDGEIPGRSMSEIPHPFITESMKRFASLPATEKSKIRFIHFNHTNPALKSRSDARKQVLKAGFHFAEEKEKFTL